MTRPRALPVSVDDLSATSRSILEELAGVLDSASRVLCITGAGVSADSGLPTYRGIGGLYEGKLAAEGAQVEDLLCPETLERDPELCWRYLRQIEEACRGALPNRAHEVLASWETSRDVWVLTQNVDGLHRAAGSRQVLEIHGTLHALVCRRCGWRASVPDYSALLPVPRCPDCAAVVRPDVALFGETLCERKVARLHEQIEAGFDVVLSVGTTSLFPYIAGPVLHAVARSIPTAEINPGRSEVSELVRWRLRERAAVAFEALDRLMGTGSAGRSG